MSALSVSIDVPARCGSGVGGSMTVWSALLLQCAHATSSSHLSSSSSTSTGHPRQLNHSTSGNVQGSSSSHTSRSAATSSSLSAVPVLAGSHSRDGGSGNLHASASSVMSLSAASSSHQQHQQKHSTRNNSNSSKSNHHSTDTTATNNSNSATNNANSTSVGESQRHAEKRRVGATPSAVAPPLSPPPPPRSVSPASASLMRKAKKSKSRRGRENASARLSRGSSSRSPVTTSRTRRAAVAVAVSTNAISPACRNHSSTNSNANTSNNNIGASSSTAAATSSFAAAGATAVPSPRRRNAVVIAPSSSPSSSTINNSNHSGSIESARSAESIVTRSSASSSSSSSKPVGSVSPPRRARRGRSDRAHASSLSSTSRVRTARAMHPIRREHHRSNRALKHTDRNNNHKSDAREKVSRYGTLRSSSVHPHHRTERIDLPPASTAPNANHTGSSSVLASHAKRKHKKLRVCVLGSKYEKGSKMAEFDDYWCSPQYYILRNNRSRYSFADVNMNKLHAYRTIRELVASNKYDVFFNLCDGAKDEDRAGVDVVHALEEMNAAFTGGDSHGFEPNKITMKLMVSSCGVRVPNFVRLVNDHALAKKCRHLRFPVIVKHESGYASEGIHHDSRCQTLDELTVVVQRFIKEYNHALVEEFIRGREGTVLACADAQSPHGVKVFRPLMFHFLQSPDDFQYFERKWTVEFNARSASALPASDPAYSAIVNMARHAHRYILNSVGYGRVDFRVEEGSNVPYFLEINPNCGMWYSPKDGGDYADAMVLHDPHWNHERFFRNAVARALREQNIRRPWHILSHDRQGEFTTRASRSVLAGRLLFDDAHHPVPVITRAVYRLSNSSSGASAASVEDEEPKVGCVIERGDGKTQSVALRHSCEPNMQLVHGRTLTLEAKRAISAGEELTIDYATLRDEAMPTFACPCGTEKCRGVIFATQALPRTVELKSMRRWIREKKSAWLTEKANRSAERLARRRLNPNANHNGGSSSNVSSNHASSSDNSGTASSLSSAGLSSSSRSSSAESSHHTSTHSNPSARTIASASAAAASVGNVAVSS